MTADEKTAILTALDPTQHRTKAGRQDGRYRTDLRPLVQFLVESGLRAGEACNLRWSDIDWTAEVVPLRKTKAGKAQHIPLSAEAVAILRAVGLRDADAYVFGWPDGRPWTPGYVTHAFGDAVEDAGVKDLHVHDPRHTFACRLLRGGVDIYTVSKLLRHASVVMSERYAHLSQADLKAAVECQRATSSLTPHFWGGWLRARLRPWVEPRRTRTDLPQGPSNATNSYFQHLCYWNKRDCD
jgi:integrase